MRQSVHLSRPHSNKQNVRARSSLNAPGAEKEHTTQVKGGGSDAGAHQLGAGLG